MRKQRIVLALGLCAGFVLASCGGSDSAARTKNAALAKPPVVLKGSCNDGEMIEGTDDDDCVIDMKVGKATRKVSIQSLNGDGDWETVASAIAKKGNLKIDLPATDEEGVWLDGAYTYRVFASRMGKNPEFVSDEVDVIYGSEVASDDSAAMGDEEDAGDSGSSPEMQTAMADIEKPATRFDDNCAKIFNRIDCDYMFRPGKGPDFITLGKSKWVKMCSTLLKRPETDCEMEYQFATNNPNKGMQPGMQPGQGGTMQPGQPGQPGMQPGQGGTMQPGANPGPGLDPVKLENACKAIGMSEADCKAALQLGPVAAMQKFADKAEAFCMAYGAKSCADLMMQAAGGAAGQGGAMQPGAQPGQTGQPGQPGQPGTMQPGQSGTMQPNQPGTMGGNTMSPPTTIKK